MKIKILINMLREIDTEKNSKRDLKMILEWIANEMEQELENGKDK